MPQKSLFDALKAYEESRGYGANSEEEVVARCCESFLSNEAFVNHMCRTNEKAARSIYKFVQEIRADIEALRTEAYERMGAQGYAADYSPETGILAQFGDIDRIAKLWEKGLREVSKKKASKSDAKSESARMSKFDGVPQFEAHKYYDGIVQKVGELKPTGYTLVGEFADDSIYEKIGLPSGRTYFDNSKIFKELNKTGDPLPIGYLQKVPEILANPIVITEAKKPNTVNVFGEVRKENGVPILVGIVATKDVSGRNVITKVRTVHARSKNLQNLITDASVLYISDNKNKAKDWFQTSRIQMPLGGTKFGFIRRITLSDDIVKLSDLNSQKRFRKKDNIKLIPQEDSSRVFEMGNVTATVVGSDVELEGGTLMNRNV